MVGQGNIPMDITLFICCCAACGAAAYQFWAVNKKNLVCSGVAMLRLLGWLTICMRFADVMLETGDIAISITAAMAWFFMVAAEFAMLLPRPKD